jgi:predicted ribosome-associated RNA-binding protein Tma20
VTKPTTIKAITDMPAKIPRPIGSTEIFFPGIWKADSAVEDGEEEEALSATVTGDVPLLLVVDMGAIAPVIDGKVGDEVVEEVGSVTEESP